MAAMAACSSDEPTSQIPEMPATPEQPEYDGQQDSIGTPAVCVKMLVAYFSEQGHMQAVAEQIAELTGADIYRIEAEEQYADNSYNDSERIQDEAYNDRRHGVINLPSEADIAQYDTIFVGSLLVAPTCHGCVYIPRIIRFERQARNPVLYLRSHYIPQRVNAEDIQPYAEQYAHT